MKILFKKLDENAKKPVKAEGHEADFCYDCYAVSEEEIAPNVWNIILASRFSLLTNLMVTTFVLSTFVLVLLYGKLVWC